MARQVRAAVVRFPGSNCDLDAVGALRLIQGVQPELVWHEDSAVSTYDAVIIPGGFSFGDSLRAGAIAAKSPAIRRVARLADRGVPVLGICNGFQTLIEAGLLPGALLRNSTLRFVCRWVNVKVESTGTSFTKGMKKGQVLKMPIAHNEGRFFAQPEELGRLRSEGRVVFRYCTDDGKATPSSNPTGTTDNIAGISNTEGNVVGLMPHPERASESILSPFGGADGRLLFENLVRSA